MTEEKLVDVYIENIPEKTRDRFKAACALNGSTMRETLRDFMSDYATDVLGEDSKIGEEKKGG